MSDTGALSPAAHQTLRTLPALRGLSERDREEIAYLFREESAARGTVVMREGEPGTSLYVVVSGALEVAAGGRTVARLGAGEWFGEMAVLGQAPRSATVRVVLDCRLLVLEREAVTQLLARHPRLYEALAAVLSHRLSRLLRGEPTTRHLVIGVDNRGGWRGAAELVAAVAASIERQVARPVALVRVVPAGHSSLPGRSDVVIAVAAGGDVREQLAAELAARAERVAATLVEVDPGLGPTGAGAFGLVEVLLVLADGGAVPADAGGGATMRSVVVQDRRRGPTDVLGHTNRVVLPMAETRRAAAVDRLARSLLGRSVGVALGSGTAYGLAHIGVLAVLEEAGVPVDAVAGSSMGALVGAAYALGLRAADLGEVAETFAVRSRWVTLAPSLLGMALDHRLLPAWLGDPFLRFLATFGPVRDATFTDLELPFRAVATDIETGARVELGDGSLLGAIRASASVPGVVTPFRVGDRVLVDGGAADPVPSETVRAMGAATVIAVNAVPPLAPRAQGGGGALEWLNPLAYLRPGGPPIGNVEAAVRALHILQHELGNARAAEADVLITPRLDRFSMLDFAQAGALIAAGAEAARAALGAIRAACAGAGNGAAR